MQHNETLSIAGSNIKVVLGMLTLNIYVTVDLVFYADILGMHKMSHWWCPWSLLLNHPQWQLLGADKKGEKCNHQMILDTYDKLIKNPKLPVNEWQQLSHYPSILPQMFVPPPLHLEIGLVNDVWSDLMKLIELNAEDLPETELNAQNNLAEAEQNLSQLTDDKKEIEMTFSVDAKQNGMDINILKKQVKIQETSNAEKAVKSLNVQWLTQSIEEAKDKIAKIKEHHQEVEKHCKNLKKAVEQMCKDRGH